MTRCYHNSKLPCRFISVFHKHFKIFRLTLFAWVVFFVSSCEEGPTKIGSGLLPGSDNVIIESIDTLSVWSYTMYDDSIRTDNPSVSYLGQIHDPYFGTTTAEFVTQIRLGSEWGHIKYTVDSVKMYLTLLDVKGGSGVTHTLRICETDELLNIDSAYYSNKPVLKADSVNNILFKNYIALDLPVLKPDTINHIILNLPVEFGEYLIRDTSKLNYDSKTDFRSFFKGLYFRISSSADPALVSLSLAPPSTFGEYNNFIVLFMHNSTAGQAEYYFILDAMNKNASFNRFSHDFNTADEGKKIEHINDGYRDTLSYLQYLNGVYTKITLPGLESLKSDPYFKKNIAVNKARLTVPVYFDGDLYQGSTAPSNLLLRYKTKSGLKYVVPDYSISSSFLDGKIDTAAGVYNFNIPAFVQGYLKDVTGNIEPELEIYQVAGTKNVILKANDSKTPVKFEFTYTKF